MQYLENFKKNVEKEKNELIEKDRKNRENLMREATVMMKELSVLRSRDSAKGKCRFSYISIVQFFLLFYFFPFLSFFNLIV